MVGMRRIAGVMALLALAGAAGAAHAASADLVLYNGKVLTVDKRFSIRSAVAVRDGKIVAVGGDDLLERYPRASRTDLHGRTVMPGFIDTHVHVASLSHRAVEPAKAKSIADIQRMVAAKAAELGPGEWIEGLGWDEALLEEKRPPTRADLDAAAPNNPVVLKRAGGHSSVSNSMALRLAGIDANTPDPKDGVIERQKDGEPNGIIRERIDIIAHLVPDDTPAQQQSGYVVSLKRLLSLGITTAMDAYTTLDDEPIGQGGRKPGDERGPFDDGRPSWAMFRSLYAAHGAELPRLVCYIAWPGAERLREFPHHTGYGDDMLKLGPVGETPYDGGFSGPTALTKEDYKALPGFRGTAFMTPDQLKQIVEVSASLGWQLGIHAIGDQAIETVASTYDSVLRTNPKPDHRWFLAHFTMIPSAKTMRMMAADGVWAAAQPNFLYKLEARYEKTLDGYRLQHANPVATPLSYGIGMAFGSDNLPNGPMVGLYAAITRKGPDGKVFGADEAVSRQEAIRLYTEKAAYLAWDEKKKGTLEPGKLADLIVLDGDPLTVPAQELLNIRVDMTFIGGRIEYDRYPSRH
jgi:predicted amidohydrolase YtcJ